jgi:hypothetical protein
MVLKKKNFLGASKTKRRTSARSLFSNTLLRRTEKKRKIWERNQTKLRSLDVGHGHCTEVIYYIIYVPILRGYVTRFFRLADPIPVYTLPTYQRYAIVVRHLDNGSFGEMNKVYYTASAFGSNRERAQHEFLWVSFRTLCISLISRLLYHHR